MARTPDMHELVDRFARALARQYVEAVERAVEESLETDHGVLVWWDIDGIPRAEVNTKVPARTIYEHVGRHHTVPQITHVRV